MPTPTTTYSFSKPTVGGDDNAWGTELNNNLDKLDDLLDGTLSITPNLATGWEVGGVAVTSTAAELNILDGVTASAAEINILDGVTSTTAELNILDGVTATTAELNYVDGVTSNIQTQLNAKQPLDADLTAIAALTPTADRVIVGNGTTWTTAELPSGGILAVNASAPLASSGGTSPTISLSGTVAVANGGTGATTASGARTNLGAQATITGGATTITSSNLTTSRALVSDGSGKVAVSTVTSTEVGYLAGVTSSIQTQLNGKAATTTQDQATWEAGTSTTETIVSPAKVKAAIDALVPAPKAFAEAYVTYSGTTPTMVAEYGMATVSRPGAGDTAFTFDTAQPDTNYTIESFMQSVFNTTDARYQYWVLTKSTTGFTVRWRFTTLVASDLNISVVCKRLV